MTGHEPTSGRAHEQLKVAIVEDDARVRRALMDLVQSKVGFAVESTDSSGRALLDDAGREPDVVLLDLLLPTASDGIGLLRELRSRNRPVVAISVLGSLRQQAMAAGAFAFFEKGAAEIEWLHDTLRRAANSA